MRTTFRRLLAEPLLQFLVLGLILFFVVQYIQRSTDKQAYEISVDTEQVNRMIVNFKSQTGNLPTKQQLDAIIEDFIREEILYREAKKMGLDNDDEIIRRRLSQKLDFLQSDLSEIPEPSENDLKKFYTEHPDLFSNDARVSFSHIYFSTDNSSDSIAKQRALSVLHQLNESKLTHAPEKGDRFPLQYDYTDQAAVDIQQNFGDQPILKELFKGTLNAWTGPVQSGYGWHLIYINKIDSAALIPFDAIKDEVITQYTAAEKAKQNKKGFDKLSGKYSINRKYLHSN